jgi:anti-sigma factor RsiW
MAAPSIAPRMARAAPRWQAMAASAILAAGLGSASTWLALRASVQDTNLADTLIADHKRGLLSGQPFDVASSDRHTVKPWFATRFALAPKVVDLAPQGFPLAGGRIDVIAGAPAPVLIYRHNEHFISLTALPAQTASAPQTLVIEGYSVQVWHDGGTDYWAISDIDPAELSKFRQLFERMMDEILGHLGDDLGFGFLCKLAPEIAESFRRHSCPSPPENSSCYASPPNRVLNRDQLIDLVKGREWTGYAGGVDPGDAVADQDGSRFRLWFAVPAMFSPRPPSASLRRQQSFDLRDRMMSEILGHLGDDLGFGFLLLRPLNSSLTAP